MNLPGPIAIFDSGYGGLTVLKSIRKKMPEYDYIYLGDNARTPYGNRSYEVVYEYTRQAVIKLFEMGAHLVILACNTASAKALRTIQQNDLSLLDPERRVLGVIRPSVEYLVNSSKTKVVGVLGTEGTVSSKTYKLEIKKLSQKIKVVQQAAPLWVPLVENNELKGAATSIFVKKYTRQLLKKDPNIDRIILGCTHYPLLMKQIRKSIPKGVEVYDQGPIVAKSLKDYLARHPEMEEKCSKNGKVRFYTTDDTKKFNRNARLFLGRQIKAERIQIG